MTNTISTQNFSITNGLNIENTKFSQSIPLEDIQNSDINQLLELKNKIDNFFNESNNPQQALREPKLSNTKAIATAANAVNSIKPEEIQLNIDDISQVIASLLQKMKENSAKSRDAESNEKINLHKKAAQKLKEAADKRFTAALVQGIFQIAGSVAQMGFSFAAMKTSIQGIKNEAKFESKNNDLQKLQSTKTTLEDKLENLKAVESSNSKKLNSLEKLTGKNSVNTKKEELQKVKAGLLDDIKNTTNAIETNKKSIDETKKYLAEDSAMKEVAKSGGAKAYSAITEKKADFLKASGEAIPAISKATGDIIAAKLNQQADRLEKEAEELKAEAEKIGNDSKKSNDALLKLEEFLQSLQKNLQEMENSNHEINIQLATSQSKV